MANEVFDKWGIIIALVVLVFSSILFWYYSNKWAGSIAAAILASALTWFCYVMLKWLFLALKR